MGRGLKVVVAMSGGVDSSVAAALLKAEGHEVIGITMQLLPPDLAGEADGFGGCCGIDAIADARRVAHRLEIPHYVANFRREFARRVIDDFSREYARGRTPNPCIRCNQHLKFDALLRRARELGADAVATGHYARIDSRDGGHRVLRKGRDRRKDQSYVLYMMTQEHLASTLFPVGEFTKDEVRTIAADLDMPVAAKPDSQEICFVPGDDYAAFLEAYAGLQPTPGPIVDRRGNVLGKHRGISAYTVGQRRGLGIAGAEPRYVVAIDSGMNTVVVGAREDVRSSELTASGMSWLSPEGPRERMGVSAKVRYRHREAEAIVSPMGEGQVRVRFREPQIAVAPGQAVVFYDGDVVLGGGTIESARVAEMAW